MKKIVLGGLMLVASFCCIQGECLADSQITITSVKPVIGQTIQITGSGFVNGDVVNFGNTVVQTTVVDANTISCQLPKNLAGKTIDLYINSPDQHSSNHLQYSISQEPIITSISPGTGFSTDETLAQLTGYGFTSGTVVTLESLDGKVEATCKVISVSDESISFLIPPHVSGRASIVLTNPDGQKGTVPFTTFVR